MARHYELLSGEKIKLKSLKRSERGHIKLLKKLIAECRNHDKKSYFHVLHHGIETLIIEGKIYTARTQRELYYSDHYRIASDMIKRYWYRCFGNDENFEDRIRKEGLEEEYSRWQKTSNKY